MIDDTAVTALTSRSISLPHTTMSDRGTSNTSNGGGWGGRRDNSGGDRWGDSHYGGGSAGSGGGRSSSSSGNREEGGWRRSSASDNRDNGGGNGGGWGRGGQSNGNHGGGRWNQQGNSAHSDNRTGGAYWIDRERNTNGSARNRPPSGSDNRQYQYHGGGGRGQRRQGDDRGGGGAQRHHPYGNARASRDRDRDRDRPRNQWSAPTRDAPNGNGRSALLQPKLEEVDAEDDVEVIDGDTDMVDNIDNCISLKEKVTPETWDSCTWDEKIASQHPDWPDQPPFTVDGTRYLRPSNPIEKVLPSCPFDALKDECRTDAWLRRKKKAAEDAFEKGWKAINEDNFANCQLNESEVKKFFDALPYNVVFLVSFDVLGIYAKDETHCYCPCSSKCAMWRKQFGLIDIMGNCKEVDDCGNTFKSSEPHGLMQHLEIKSRNKKGLHLFVQLYVKELYGPPYCGNVGHKGLYPKSHKFYREAEAHEKKVMVRAYKKLEGELEQERREKEKLEKEVKQREEDFKQLEKVSKDLAGRLKDQEKNAKLLNVDVEQMKELEKDMDSERIDQYYQSYRGIMQGFINMIDMGNKGTGGSVEIKVSDKFKVEELFEELYEGKKKSFLFKPIDNNRNENVAGKILRDWNIVFDTSEISKLKSVKQETEAIDQGGPSKEFMNLVWKRLHILKVEAKGKDGEIKSCDLLYRDDTGYSMLQLDAKLHVFLDSIPVSDVERMREKIDAYYQAIGRLFLHAIVSHWHSSDYESSSRLLIPTTALPPFYRQYLLRGCKPDDEEYPNHEVWRDITEMGFSFQVEDIIGANPDIFFGDEDLEPYTDKTFYSKFLPSSYLNNRRIALENISMGLTLEGHLPIPAILKSIPSKALERIAFADEGFDSAEDVIAFLEPVYRTQVMVPDEMGVICEREVESQVIESQILFFRQTLPNLLRSIHATEKVDREKYAEKTRKRMEFLSRFVHYATASSHLPDPGLMETKDKIKIEFDASEMTEDSLPMAHTCVNTLKFPLLVYDNNAETLREKLQGAFRACSNFGAFGMS